MNYDDDRLPARLRGQIRSTEMVLRYVKEMTKAIDAGLRLGFAEHQLNLEATLQGFREEAQKLLHTDNREAAAAAGAR